MIRAKFFLQHRWKSISQADARHCAFILLELKKRKDENTNVTTKSTSKDIAYDMLHNIGKLLYAKREEGTRNLQYDPDVVISSTGMNPMLVGSFLSQNAGSFYSDIDDLGELSSLLSDVDLLSQNERNEDYK